MLLVGAGTSGNASGFGLGMQACLIGPVDQGADQAGLANPHLSSLGASAQLFNISKNGTIRIRGSPGSPGSCLGQAPGGGHQVVQGFGAFELCDQGWTAKPTTAFTEGGEVPSPDKRFP